MPRVATSASLAALALAIGLTVGAKIRADDDETFGLPDDPGRDEVIGYCGACHSMMLVLQQGQTRDGWAELLDWMYEEQGMAQLDAEEEGLVLDYLAKHVNPESQKQRLRERGILP